MEFSYLKMALIVVHVAELVDICLGGTCFYADRHLKCRHGCCGLNGVRHCCDFIQGGSMSATIIGCIPPLALVVIFIYSCCKHRQSKQQKDEQTKNIPIYTVNGMPSEKIEIHL